MLAGWEGFYLRCFSWNGKRNGDNRKKQLPRHTIQRNIFLSHMTNVLVNANNRNYFWIKIISFIIKGIRSIFWVNGSINSKYLHIFLLLLQRVPLILTILTILTIFNAYIDVDVSIVNETRTDQVFKLPQKYCNQNDIPL